MRRIKKTFYHGGAAALLVVLAIIRCACPGVSSQQATNPQPEELKNDIFFDTCKVERKKSGPLPFLGSAPCFRDAKGEKVKHKVYSVVGGYTENFPDLQEVQILAAMEWGVTPVENRTEAELRKGELVYVGSNPYYVIDKRMRSSIPYLVPRAADLLQTIAVNFMDSLAIKGLPLHRIIATSMLRTEEDVRRLRRVNVNASDNSCHRYGTTFDITYIHYAPLAGQNELDDPKLQFVLSEVLRDVRKAGLCYVKYERKQSCFHITVR